MGGMQDYPIILGFTAGELSPWLSTRFDLQAYQRGAAVLQNFLVQPYGGLRRRNGTAYVARAGSQVADAARLFSFRYSETDALLLEFFPGGMRVFRQGVLLYGDAGAPYVLSVPWTTAAQIASLRMIQVNDLLYVTSPVYPPVVISRYGDTDWGCEVMHLDPYPRETYAEQAGGVRVLMEADSDEAQVVLDMQAPPVTEAMAGGELLLVDAPLPERTLFQKQKFETEAAALPDLSTTIIEAGQRLYERDSATEMYHFYTCYRAYTPDLFNGSLSPIDYPSHFHPGLLRLDAEGLPYEVNGDWEVHTHGTWNALWELWRSYDSYESRPDISTWQWTRIRSFEQNESAERKNWAISGSEDRPCRMVLVCRSCSALTVPAMLYFRSLGGMREYRLLITERVNSHVARARVLSHYVGPRKSFYSRRWSFGAFGPRNGYPRFAGLHQGRLWFGGTAGQPTTLFASSLDDFRNFRMGSNDDDALHLTLATDDQSRICWICPARNLLVGTSTSEWTLASPDGSAVTASNASFSRQSSVGSECKEAYAVENAVFYVQRGGKRLREISYKLEADGFTSTDTSLLAEHLFESGVKQWAVQRGSSAHLWVLMNDGSVCVLTTNVAQQVTAWQRVTFPGRRVCYLETLSQAGSSEDEVWFVMQNLASGEVSLERLSESRTYLDTVSGVSRSGARLFVGLYLAGQRVFIYPVGMPQAAVAVDVAADGSIIVPEGTLLPSGRMFLCGVPYDSLVQTMPMEREAGFNAVQQLGRVKLRLLGCDPAFEFKAAHVERWECFDPSREGLASPFTGVVRVSQIPAPGVGQGFCLRYNGMDDFRLLSLGIERDFHGK